MSDGHEHERWQPLLPFGLLALATAVALLASPSFDGDAPSIPLQLGLTAATAAWVAVFSFVLEQTPRTRAVHYIGRTALAFALVWVNPFYAIFGFIGFTDAFDVFTRRSAIYLAMLATAVMQGGSQSGGLPVEDRTQGVVFVALVGLNFCLGVAFTTMHIRMERSNDQRGVTIGELERLNAELQTALDENAVLHRQLLDQAREGGVQQERQRLAREIHDTIAQNLAGVVTQLEAARDGDPMPRCERALGLARDALTEARRSVQDLAPIPLDGGTLAEAVTDVVGAWSGDREVKADLVVTGEPARLHPEVEATVLRITQESLTNVAKHARAHRVGVTLSYLDDQVILDVRDDGVGFDPGGPVGDASFGLRAMRQRAERLAGVLDVESQPGGGTAVSARLPALGPGAAA